MESKKSSDGLKNLQQLQKRYTSFVSCLRKRIKDNKEVNKFRLQDFLFQLDAFVVEDRGRLLSGVRVDQAFDRLSSADDIVQLVAEKCASFFHYEVLLNLSIRYCADCKNKELSYEKHFRAYIRKPTVSEFLQIAELKKSFVYETKKLTLKIKKVKMSSKLIDIVDLRDNLAALLGLRKHTLNLINVEDGCVTFLIPKNVANILFVRHPLSVNQIENARCLSVLSLQCGDITTMDFPEGDSTIESESTLEISEDDDGDEPDPHIGVTKYRLFVKGYRGESFVVVHKGGTVDQLYETIEKKTSMVQSKMKLLHPEKDLEQGQNLSDHPEIENNSILFLVMRNPGGGKAEETVAQQCPDCQSLAERLATQKCVVCPVCSNEKHRTFRFCSSCLNEWRSSEGAETCGNKDCTGQDPCTSVDKDTSATDQDAYMLVPDLNADTGIVSSDSKCVKVRATQSSSSENKTSPNRVIMTPCKIFIQGVDATMFTAVIPGGKFESYKISDLHALLKAALRHSMDDYQLSYLGQMVDVWRHGREMVLGDYGVKSESTLVLTKLGLVLDVTDPKVDVCFLVDCTMSMSSSITAVKDNIQSIRDKMVAEYKTCDQVFAFVRYTDFSQSKGSRTTSLNFTHDAGEFTKFVSAIRTCNGGDFAEDVMGGLKVALHELTWRPEACKILIHIGDAPGHGRRYHKDINDNYPDYPEGRLPNDVDAGIWHDSMMGEVARKDIQYWFGFINKSITDKMISVFNDSLRELSQYRLIIRQFDAMQPSQVGNEIKRSVIDSVYGNAALKLARVQDFMLDSNVPDWKDASITWLTASKTPLVHARKLADLQKSALSLEKPSLRFTFKIAPNPFAEGAECLVYYGLDSVNNRKIVLKRFKFTGEEFNTLECYMKELEVRTIARTYAQEFNEESFKPPETCSLEFTPLDVVQCTGGDSSTIYMAETLLKGTIEKFNNNHGVVKSTSRHIDLMQAFSHYTWVKSKSVLICDLQGYKKARQDCIILTDPAVHSSGSAGRYGSMDRGLEGVKAFFKTHECSKICEDMKLERLTI